MAGQRDVWSIGLRNPFRIAFGSEAGDLWVPDVGEKALEEIKVLRSYEGGGDFVNLG